MVLLVPKEFTPLPEPLNDKFVLIGHVDLADSALLILVHIRPLEAKVVQH